MNRYSIFALGFTMLLGLGSCGSEDLVTSSEGEAAGANSNNRITFSLNGGAKISKTRAQDALTSKDYEKNIQNCYVVAYKNNRMTKAIKATATANTDEFTADLAASGVLDIYFIANVEEGSGKLSDRITSLAAGSQSSELEALTADQTPGAYVATATDGFFPMIGKVSATINTQTAGGTDIGTVEIKRLAARIDIDDVLPTGFTISGVTVNSRYNQSLLVRSLGNVSMTSCGSVSNDNDYTISSVPFQGKIYLYEDPTASTELVIHGTYNGHNVNPVVKFNDPVRAAPKTTIPVVRNHIYNITLSKEVLTETLEDLQATITVVDWTTGEEIAKSTAALTDRTTVPTVAINGISNANCTDDGNSNLTSTDAAAISFTATVTTSGSTTSKLVCVDPNDGIGILITPGSTTYNLDGTTTQTFTVAIDANTGTARTITFRAENLLNRDTYKEFTVAQAAGS